MESKLLPHDAFRIILYYCYVTIEDVEAHLDLQKKTCESRELMGRVRVSCEGINGVLSGQHSLLEEYERVLREHLSMTDAGDGFELDIKYCRLREDLPVAANLFHDLRVERTKQVITLVDAKQDQATKKSKRRQHLKAVEETLMDYQRVQSIWNDAQEHFDSAHLPSAEYLSPSQWNDHLAQVSPDDNAILLDCRNFYESNVGHFVCPNARTLLTNTRKYQELPQTLVDERSRLASSRQIFMYCTGGVRCVPSSQFLRKLLDDEGYSQTQIYQLHGGIQRYLEHMETESTEASYYRGKNFVFDPRRTDPLHKEGDVVGVCVLCQNKHDDYDNGHSPSENMEARCCTCRILILVCNTCRPLVACWGEESTGKQQVFCGKTICWHKPLPREIKGHGA